MKNISKLILGIEAIIILYPTLLGFMLCFGAVIPFITGAFTIEHLINFFTGLVIFLSLISGWRILFWVLTNGPQKEEKIENIWWVFSFVGVALTLVAWVFVFLENYEIYTLHKPNPTQILMWGVYFLVPFTHLFLEMRWQKALTRHSS